MAIRWGGDCRVIFGGGKVGGGSVDVDGIAGGGSCGCGFVWWEGPASGWGLSGHNFFAAPSPLSLLIKLVLVSISSWLTAFFFFNFFVAVGDTEDTDDAGVFKVAGVSISFGEVTVAFVGAFVGTFVGVDSGVTDGSVVVAAGNGVLVCF